MKTAPILRVTNLRRDQDRYRFDLTLEVTLRDVYYRRSGEFGFSPQATPMPMSAEMAGVFAEALEALRPSLDAEVGL
jgi:hypothetical protein